MGEGLCQPILVLHSWQAASLLSHRQLCCREGMCWSTLRIISRQPQYSRDSSSSKQQQVFQQGAPQQAFQQAAPQQVFQPQLSSQNIPAVSFSGHPASDINLQTGSFNLRTG